MAALPKKTASARAKSSPPSSITTIPSLVKWLTIAPADDRQREQCAERDRRGNEQQHGSDELGQTRPDPAPRLEAELREDVRGFGGAGELEEECLQDDVPGLGCNAVGVGSACAPSDRP